MASFGENFRKLRDRAGMKQEDVRVALKLKTAAPISLMEGMRGPKTPRPSTIVRVAKALGVEPWELLEGVETELDQLRNRRDLPSHSDAVQSAHVESHAKAPLAPHGTEAAIRDATLPGRKAPDAETRRLREEIAMLRAQLEVVARAVIGFGTPESPAAHSVAPPKPRRRRRTGKGA